MIIFSKCKFCWRQQILQFQIIKFQNLTFVLWLRSRVPCRQEPCIRPIQLEEVQVPLEPNNNFLNSKAYLNFIENMHIWCEIYFFEHANCSFATFLHPSLFIEISPSKNSKFKKVAKAKFARFKIINFASNLHLLQEIWIYFIISINYIFLSWTP